MDHKVKKLIAREWLLLVKVVSIAWGIVIIIGNIDTITDSGFLYETYQDLFNESDISAILFVTAVPYFLVQLIRSVNWAKKIKKENVKN